MPETHHGQKPKIKCNISSLHDQCAPEPLKLSTKLNLDHADDPNQNWDPLLKLDSLKSCWKKKDQESNEENIDNNENMKILTKG